MSQGLAIRSFNPRPRAGGDRCYSVRASSMTAFQSTPPRGGRQDSCCGSPRMSSFNPRPRAGGDGPCPWLGWPAVVSIHAPARGATVGHQTRWQYCLCDDGSANRASSTAKMCDQPALKVTQFNENRPLSCSRTCREKQGRLGFALQNQGAFGVVGGLCAHMFDLVSPVGPQIVEAQAILLIIHLAE